MSFAPTHRHGRSTVQPAITGPKTTSAGPVGSHTVASMDIIPLVSSRVDMALPAEGSTYATAAVDTPIGRFALAALAAGLTHVQFAGSRHLPHLVDCPGADATARDHVDTAARALHEYFAGTRRGFADLVLAPRGTPFELRVWEALRTIPFGATRSYGEIARQVGEADAARAVGVANNRNPIAIIIPCHRVIGADGGLVGYGGGLRRKAWVLAHEGTRTLSLFP